MSVGRGPHLQLFLHLVLHAHGLFHLNALRLQLTLKCRHLERRWGGVGVSLNAGGRVCGAGSAAEASQPERVRVCGCVCGCVFYACVW